MRLSHGHTESTHDVHLTDGPTGQSVIPVKEGKGGKRKETDGNGKYWIVEDRKEKGPAWSNVSAGHFFCWHEAAVKISLIFR